MSFDLRERPFVEAVTTMGERKRYGLLGAFREAESIREVRHACSLDDFAVYRLMLAVLQWVKPSINDEERQFLESQGRFADSLIDELSATIGERFDLFHPDKPFLQTKADGKPDRPVTDLFAELPADTAINHFRHVYDGHVGVCPACCLRGLLRLSAFCTQGGQGKSPSINDAPPVYFLPMGRNLFETLCLNWPMTQLAGDRPVWEGSGTSGEIGVLEGFTWQPRQVWLQPDSAPDGICILCGNQEADTTELTKPRLVRQINFRKGRSRSGERSRPWRDPHVAYVLTGKSRATLLRASEPVQLPFKAAAMWRQVAAAVLDSLISSNPEVGVEAVRVANRLLPSNQPLPIRTFLAHTRQAKWLDHGDELWSIPGELRSTPTALQALAVELEWANALVLEIESVLLKSLLPPKTTRSGLEIVAAWALCVADLETEIEQAFRCLRFRLAQEPVNNTVRKEWRDSVERVLLKLITPTVLEGQSSAILRRLEQEQTLWVSLEKSVKRGLS